MIGKRTLIFSIIVAVLLVAVYYSSQSELSPSELSPSELSPSELSPSELPQTSQPQSDQESIQIDDVPVPTDNVYSGLAGEVYTLMKNSPDLLLSQVHMDPSFVAVNETKVMFFGVKNDFSKETEFSFSIKTLHCEKNETIDEGEANAQFVFGSDSEQLMPNEIKVENITIHYKRSDGERKCLYQLLAISRRTTEPYANTGFVIYNQKED